MKLYTIYIDYVKQNVHEFMTATTHPELRGISNLNVDSGLGGLNAVSDIITHQTTVQYIVVTACPISPY